MRTDPSLGYEPFVKERLEQVTQVRLLHRLLPSTCGPAVLPLLH